MIEDTILTIGEVAKYLRVSERTVYDWAQKGEIPAGKIGNIWRFKKSSIEKWVEERLSSPQSSTTVQIKNILSPNRVIFISQRIRYEALTELADTLATAPQVKRADELVSEIIRREELMSTAIGCGIAIPHVRLSSVTDLVMAVGICKTAIADFNAIDGRPVNLIFMIAAAYAQHSYYLRTLSYLSETFKEKSIRDSLAAAETTKQAYELLIESDANREVTRMATNY